MNGGMERRYYCESVRHRAHKIADFSWKEVERVLSLDFGFPWRESYWYDLEIGRVGRSVSHQCVPAVSNLYRGLGSWTRDRLSKTWSRHSGWQNRACW